ncbi:MAG: hypothetical protein PUE12_11115, partial [Oscillospiraceae bacterium]|nr:hypothetical protein [Oscillospiraceae bacterium]
MPLHEKNFLNQAKKIRNLQFTFTAGDPHCFGETKLYAQCLIDRILEELGLNAAINSYKGFSKIKY